jgi:hypothetical protein
MNGLVLITRLTADGLGNILAVGSPDDLNETHLCSVFKKAGPLYVKLELPFNPGNGPLLLFRWKQSLLCQRSYPAENIQEWTYTGVEINSHGNSYYAGLDPLGFDKTGERYVFCSHNVSYNPVLLMLDRNGVVCGNIPIKTAWAYNFFMPPAGDRIFFETTQSRIGSLPLNGNFHETVICSWKGLLQRSVQYFGDHLAVLDFGDSVLVIDLNKGTSVKTALPNDDIKHFVRNDLLGAPYLAYSGNRLYRYNEGENSWGLIKTFPAQIEQILMCTDKQRFLVFFHDGFIIADDKGRFSHHILLQRSSLIGDYDFKHAVIAGQLIAIPNTNGALYFVNINGDNRFSYPTFYLHTFFDSSLLVDDKHSRFICTDLREGPMLYAFPEQFIADVVNWTGVPAF